jgi:hypothetical protein
MKTSRVVFYFVALCMVIVLASLLVQSREDPMEEQLRDSGYLVPPHMSNEGRVSAGKQAPASTPEAEPPASLEEEDLKDGELDVDAEDVAPSRRGRPDKAHQAHSDRCPAGRRQAGP